MEFLSRSPTIPSRVCKESSANWFSRLFFWWVNPLIDLGNKKYLIDIDLFDIIESEKIDFNLKVFNTLEGKEKTKKLPHSFGKIFFRLYRREFFLSFFFNLLSTLLQFSGPLCLNQILQFLDDESAPEYQGYIWAAVMSSCFFFRAIFQQHANHYMNRIAQRIQGTLSGKIYSKLLRLSSSSKKFNDTGKIMNLINLDVFAVWNFCQFLLFGLSTPIILIIAFILIVIQLSWIGVIGIFILVNGFFFQNGMQKWGSSLRRLMLENTDERTQSIHEFIFGIKIIKYFGWENMALEKIARIRERETKNVFKQALLKGWTDVISTLFPLLICIVVFTIYEAEVGELTAAKVYTVLSLFNLIQVPLSIVGHLMVTFVGARTGMTRIEKFTSMEEKSPEESNFCLFKDLPIGSISIINSDFAWGPSDFNRQNTNNNNVKTTQPFQTNDGLITENSVGPTLKNIGFSANAGDFVAVIGSVGSGKSSFAYSLLGETQKLKGNILVKGKVAYVPQEAWLMNATVRDNIVFFNEYDERRYHQILNICKLTNDISTLPGGDLTEIGERGVNLSGGQRQRISLARALYEDADIYIIDDVLSALDAHVGKHIYKHVIRRFLSGKTIIFITHALQYIQEATKILVFKEGEIIQEGPFASLWESRDDSEFKKLSNLHHFNKSFTEMTSKQSIMKLKFRSTNPTPAEKLHEGQIMKEEERVFGTVPWSVYRVYFKSGGTFFSFIVLGIFLVNQGTRFFNDWWLGAWANHEFPLTQQGFIGVYGALAVFGSVLVFIRCAMFFSMTLKISKKMQTKLMGAIFKAPMRWFDETPIGGILSRTSKDQDNVDMNLPMTMQFAFINMLKIFGTLIIAGVGTPLFLILIFVSVVIYGILIRKYLRCSREIKRIELNARGPVNSFFSETSNGLFVIRAFKKEQIFFETFQERAENYSIAVQNNMYTARWIGLRTDLFGAVLVAASGFFAVISKTYNTYATPSLIGLSMTWILLITQLLNFAIRLLADTENYMSSVQKINEFIEKNPMEADFDAPKPKNQPWPSLGVIKAENLCYKYRENLDYALKNVSFEFKSFEKIGVAGRTGSGKSTLTLGILRILELCPDESGNAGRIIIDGEDIVQIGLHILRRNITIIPQDPVLFSGTIRTNIDPFREFSDDDIASALKKVNIWRYLGGEELHMVVANGGDNFSQGQRQLICIARALIRKPKILIMDEATANVDEQSDNLIQKMIKEEFNFTTVITIAHRLNTIIQYDRIMVFEQGVLVEFDSPAKLLDKEGGKFLDLVKENGKDFEAKMRQLVSGTSKPKTEDDPSPTSPIINQRKINFGFLYSMEKIPKEVETQLDMNRRNYFRQTKNSNEWHAIRLLPSMEGFDDRNLETTIFHFQPKKAKKSQEIRNIE